MPRWVRVSKAVRCPICEHHDWCLISPDGEAAICNRTISSRPQPGGGYFHWLTEDDGRDAIAEVVAAQARVPEPVCNIDWPRLAKACEDLMDYEGLARELGVNPVVLIEMRVGRITKERLGQLKTNCRSNWCWTFPMRDQHENVIGLRLRTPDGFKYAVTGSRAGLFLVRDYKPPGPLIVCEGPTDTAAMLGLGYRAVGRSSCTGETAMLCEYAAGLDVVVFSDRDGPGRAGAERLATLLAQSAQCSVRVAEPCWSAKDARAMVQAGASRAVVDRIIESQYPWRAQGCPATSIESPRPPSAPGVTAATTARPSASTHKNSGCLPARETSCSSGSSPAVSRSAAPRTSTSPTSTSSTALGTPSSLT